MRRMLPGSSGRLLLALCLAFVAGPSLAADEASEPQVSRSFSWYEDADGFNRGLEEALSEMKPLAVYFYTDWCGYCRQLEREVLYRAEVEDYMSRVTKVRINPENGSSEAAIARRYGVVGYPSLFLHAGPGHEAKRLSGRTRRDGEWQMQTPEEFIETVQGVVDRARSKSTDGAAQGQ